MTNMTLEQFFSVYPEVAVGFSGGTDSSYLLYAGCLFAKRIRAYYVRTEFQPVFELEDAKWLASELGADLTIVQTDILNVPRVAENSAGRCYYCKTAVFSAIVKEAHKDGFSVVCDGTNASDRTEDRPGMRALGELHIRSPLRECRLSKTDIRRLSKEAGLFTWNKPAYACLATRIPTGQHITADMLARVEHAENELFSLGFTDFRVRVTGTAAKLQFTAEQMTEAFLKREKIRSALSEYFRDVLLDLNARQEQQN